MARLTRPRIVRLRLNDFRSYARLDLATPAALVALCGPNGAGKTNILEALSLFSPGRGLRRAQAAQLTRKDGGGGYALLADVAAGPQEAPVLLATALAPGERLRAARIEREPVPSAQAFLDYLSFLWLTPDQDGIFRGAAGDRRRFLDRLVLAVDSAHATRAARFESALRHRNRLLEEAATDPRWLDAIEHEIAELGVALAAARLETVGRLTALVEHEAASMAPFPFARVALEGEIEARLTVEPAAAVEDWYRRALSEGRGRDRAAGRALIGPQAADLVVIHGPKATAAALCSTGEQKALLIGLVLAQARLIAQMCARTPVLLLDEVAAHLDESRRAALFRILEALGAQVFMTGTDALLFENIGPQGALFYVQESAIRPIKGAS